MRCIKITDQYILDQLSRLAVQITCNKQAFEMEFTPDVPAADRVKYWYSVIDSACTNNYLYEFIKSNVARDMSLDPEKIVELDVSGCIKYSGE